MSRSRGSRKPLEEQPRSSDHLTKPTSTRMRRKFTDFDEHVKSQKVETPSASKWDAGLVETDSKVTVSRWAKWPSDESKHSARKLFHASAEHGTEEIKSVTKKEDYEEPFAAHKYADVSLKYTNRNLWKKELQDGSLIKFSGSSNVGMDLLNIKVIKPKMEINLPFCLAIDSTWCGSLEILDKNSGCRFYDGFVAHLPGKVCRKALEHTQLMPNVLPCTMLHCRDVWEEAFQNEIPTIEDIALFISPGNFDRSKEQYIRLLEVMDTRDLILRSLVKGIYLLIFSSKKLHWITVVSGLKMKSFLWGVYSPCSS